MKKIILILIFIFIIIIEIKAEVITSPYLPWLQDRCAIHDVPVSIAASVAIVESNFRMVNSKLNWNKSYDIGIFQINSKYIKYFKEKLWYKDLSFRAQNPYNNIEMGIMILRYLYNKTGSWDKAVRAYYSGVTGLKKDPDAGKDYLVKVINVKNTLRFEN